MKHQPLNLTAFRNFKRVIPRELVGVFQRYFMLNMFDGAFTAFGIVAGNYFLHVTNLQAIVGSLFGSAVAFTASGALAAYEAETTAEETEMGGNPGVNLRDEDPFVGVIREAEGRKKARSAVICAVIAHASSALPSLLIAAIPFFFFPILQAFVYSLCLLTLTVFIFGTYVGFTKKRNGLIYGLRYAVVVVAIVIICRLLGVEGG